MTKGKEFSDLLCDIVTHDMANCLTANDIYTNFLNELIDEKQVKAKKYLEVLLLNNQRMIASLGFFQKHRTSSQKVSWQLLATIYKYCKVPTPVKITANEEMGRIKIFASDLAPLVLGNLIDNTIRYANVTEIRIRLNYSFNSNNELVVAYEDNGKGIPKEDKEKIFEKGFGENTGLGLYLTRKILDITDIKIVEVGEPGKGVRFEITIPKENYKIEL